MQKTILIIALIAFVGVVSATQNEEFSTLWGAWKTLHKKFYSPAEEATRLVNFVNNYQKIVKFNAEQASQKKSLRLGLNKFSDLTADEFKIMYSGHAYFEEDAALVASKTVKETTVGDLADSVDWRDQGKVTPVKNQGQCGSCWAFSTTGVLESFHAIQTGELLSFSEQQIVDCASSAGFGCSGGWPNKAVDYAAQNGLELESDYPYTAQDGNCVFDSSKAKKVNTGYVSVKPNNKDELKGALNKMPVSILIEADQSIFQSYSSGVIESGCGASLDHAVLAVGYTTVGGVEAFIVKNSWGADWGQQGYVFMSTDPSQNGGAGVCGILSQPIYPN